jgi:DNA-binding protein H-NS
MAKADLASMSVDSLLKLRDDIGRVLSRKADELNQQLAQLGGSGWKGSGKQADGKRGAMKGRKVAPKYRNPKNRSETWAGRGRCRDGSRLKSNRGRGGKTSLSINISHLPTRKRLQSKSLGVKGSDEAP